MKKSPSYHSKPYFQFKEKKSGRTYRFKKHFELLPGFFQKFSWEFRESIIEKNMELCYNK